MFKNAVLTFALLVGCTKSQPAQTTPPPAATETATAPASEDTTAPAPTTPAPTTPAPTTPAPSTPAKAANKCTQSGGGCNHRAAMNLCGKAFKEGPEWGCGQDQGCCFN